MASLRNYLAGAKPAEAGQKDVPAAKLKDVSEEELRAGAVDTAEDSTGAEYDYDLLVIGGGSGGLAASKRASDLGQKVALCDFVQPSTAGTTWGLGGTCVNVGCIPKKLMHTAAIQGEMIHNQSESFGWGENKVKCDWDTLKTNIDMHIRSLNFGYTTELRKRKIKYFNAYARFVDTHTAECTDKKGNVTTVTARRILLATGGRPTLPDIPGAKEYGVSSDDIFKLKTDPGKTLVVGASYVALECAGFLNGIGRDATVMMRSIPLRGFDQDMAAKVTDYMENMCGINFHKGYVPTKLEKMEDGTVSVEMKSVADATIRTESYDTVLFATGRTPETSKIGLDSANVKLDRSGKVIVDKYDRTSSSHIYAIGDIAAGGLELTPVAIKSGQLLVDRLYNKGSDVMDYRDTPTTVFTPLEYGCCGYAEEDAKATLGAENISVFHTYFTPLEWTVPQLAPGKCYMKLIVNKNDDKVVGFHILAPNAGEITQGVGIAMRCNATKADFDRTVGIHPTIAESMTTLRITKESGEDASASGC